MTKTCGIEMIVKNLTLKKTVRESREGKNPLGCMFGNKEASTPFSL